MPAYDRATITRVQHANDIVDVVAEHLSLTKKAREMVGLCPFHEDHRPSLYVNPEKQIFKCFACGAGGSVFTFIQMQENLTFPQAVRRLAERAGIQIQADKTDTTSSADTEQIARVNNWAAKYFQKNLLATNNGKIARDYLKQRKISNQSIKDWQIGLALDSQNDLLRTAEKKKIPRVIMKQAGLIIGQKDSETISDKFVNRVMFPIIDVTGRVIGFGGRALGNQPAKYINSPATVLFDKSNSIFGLQQARREISATGTAVVVEGYTDCIMAHQFGINNVLATLGTSFTEGHARILKRYAKKIVLLFDSDAAGSEAANRALDICLSQRIGIELASLPQGKDPCEFLLDEGKEKFRHIIDNAANVLRFKWERLREKFSTSDNLADNKAVVHEYLDAIASSLLSGSLPAIDKGLFLNRLSNILGLSGREINTELQRRIRKKQKASTYSRHLQNRKVTNLEMGEGLFAAAQREVLEVLLNEPKLFEIVKQKISAEDFDVPILRKIAKILFENLNNKQEPELYAILAQTESVEASNAVVQLQQNGREKQKYQNRLIDALNVFENHKIQKQKYEIKNITDQKQFLRQYSRNILKQNPRNIGMT